MVENKPLMKFQELRLSGKDLKELPAERAAFLALLLNAYNEVNVLMRLQALNGMDTTEPGPIRAFGDSTKLFLARTLSAKLFEVVELLEAKKSWNKTSDEVINDFSKRSLEKFQKVTKQDGYQIARTLRHEIVNHYSLKAATKNIASLEDDADLTYYIHKTGGNSFAQLGEKVVFSEKFRRGVLSSKSGDNLTQFRTWLDWTLEARRWLWEVSAEFLVETMPLGPEKWKKDRVYYLDDVFVGDLGDTFAPLFLREPRK